MSKEYNKAYYARNKEREKIRTSEYRKRNMDRYRELDRQSYQRDKGSHLTRAKRYVEQNEQLVKEYQKRYRLENKEKLSEYSKVYRETNKESLQKQQAARSATPAAKAANNERGKKYRQSSLTNALSARIRTNIRVRLRKQGRGSIRHLPYNMEELRACLESKFKEGMSWERFSEIHIDHIIPLKYKNEDGTYYWDQEALSNAESEEFKKAWGLDNLQPMWSVDNVVKGCRHKG